MLEELKEKVFKANLRLKNENLIILTWGNVSGYDKETKLMVIKPSGVSYDVMKAQDMVVVDLNGNVIEGKYKPSCDTLSHLEIYKNYPELGGVVHTHSSYATAFAQAGMNIEPYGTTQADYFHGSVLCTRKLTENEVKNDYELNTGKVIIETIKDHEISENVGVLVNGHGVFAWAKDPNTSVDNALAIDKMAEIALLTKQLNPNQKLLEQYVLDKHYFRKHGKNAYYGQKF